MADVVAVDIDKIYKAWRAYLIEHSVAEHFGTDSDKSVAEFPYANLMMLGRPTNVTDLENHEVTVDLTFQTDCYIDTNKVTSLYGMDTACWEFFQELGFKRMGDSTPSKVSNSNVRRISSRFTLRNFNGRFLKDIEIVEQVPVSGTP